jgi:Spx/MgsR family transcriptional regulator
MVTLYGIKTCDTCRKALKWLDGQGIDHRFHDMRTDGLSRPKVAGWVAALGWENVLNRRSTSWRELPEKARAGLDEKTAAALMLENPTLIKRPVIEADKELFIGFDEKTRTALGRGRR